MRRKYIQGPVPRKMVNSNYNTNVTLGNTREVKYKNGTKF